MTIITIRERANQKNSPNADVIFDHTDEYPITVTDPFSEKEEKRLAWYFEEYLAFPFVKNHEFQAAAASVTVYGEALFKQVFADPDAYADYKNAVQNSLSSLQFEIVGSPEFHRLHWEALKDPNLPRAFALEAPLVRKHIKPQPFRAQVHPSPTINLLLVTARPKGDRDVGYRTIARPLVESLSQAKLKVKIDLLRPGTYETLSNHLQTVRDQHNLSGYYHVIHFDIHGALLTYPQLEQGYESNQFIFRPGERFGRGQLSPYEGQKAFLFLDGEEPGQVDPVEALELVALLQTHQIPIVILNACQSGKQMGATETSLGSYLMQAGAQLVVAMGYSVTVTAAKQFMQELYQQLFDEQSPVAAIRRARLALYNTKKRATPYQSHPIELEDWLLPVVYQNRSVHLKHREFTSEERKIFYGQRQNRYRAPGLTYEFVGRDLDILNIERRLLQRNMLLIRGMGGAGKTTLLHHLGEWWQTTNFVQQVFYFGYDQRAWTRHQIVHEIAQKVIVGEGRAISMQEWHSFAPDIQQEILVDHLRANRHLLILDNLESITGSHLAILNTLPANEQAHLRHFLTDLLGGQTLVLFGSRSGEEWLSEQITASSYHLPGLDREAALTLANLVLQRNLVHSPAKIAAYRTDPAFGQILKLLDGYPLALEVVLANLAQQNPAEILAALQAGDEGIDFKSEDKTKSILRCIDYSHSNLSEEAQKLLLCLAPFLGVLNVEFLPHYTEKLRQQPALADFNFDLLPEVLREAVKWGLLTAHEVPGYLHIQPIFPYFLRIRLNQSSSELRQAIETAFYQRYTEFSYGLTKLIISEDSQRKQIAQLAIHLEYENLFTALNFALAAHTSVVDIYMALSRYLANIIQDPQQALELGQIVLAGLENYPTDALTEQFSPELILVIQKLVEDQVELNQYDAAEEACQIALKLIDKLDQHSVETRDAAKASTYHRLGTVATGQRHWEQAEQYYHQAIQLHTRYNNHRATADIYHQLGNLLLMQQKWEQAEQYYHQALKINSSNPYQQALAYYQLGMVAQAQAQRKWEQAEQYCHQALRVFFAFKDMQRQADTYNQLGNLAQTRGMWEQAEQYYHQALKISIDYLNNPQQQAGIYYNLGAMAQEQKEWEQATQYYEKALKISIDFNDSYRIGITYGRLGTIAGSQKQWECARHHLLQALKVFSEIKDESSIEITLYNIRRLWQCTKDDTLIATAASILGLTPEEMIEVLGSEE